MTEEQQALCLGNMRLVSHCAKKFVPGLPWDELRSCGHLGLVKAAVTYRPEVNPYFASYACRCIENEIFRLLRERKKHGKVESLDRGLNAEGVRLYDLLPDDTDMTETTELRLRASEAMARLRTLPEKRQRVWELRLGLTGEPPMTHKEIARRLGCSRSRISMILTEDLTKRWEGS
jgi:RNA polymerase sporulation-specific sigma factor